MKAFSPDRFFNQTPRKMLPCAMKQISIENYQGIIKTNIADIPVDTQWIFLTGENGFGKTMVLPAIAISLFGNQDQQRILTDSDCHTWVEFKNHGNKSDKYFGNTTISTRNELGCLRLFEVGNSKSTSAK